MVLYGLRNINPRMNKKKFVLIKCPKCGQSRGGRKSTSPGSVLDVTIL